MAYSYSDAITLGLVYIPIKLVLNVKEHNIGFNMLDKKTMSRIKYKKTCTDCNNKEVKNEDIVKCYQYEKDKYVDYLRNNKNSSYVAPYSVRARENAPISMPINWKDLKKFLQTK